MRFRQRPWAILVAILATGVPGVQAQNDPIALAKREGRVVVYGSLEPDEFAVVQKIYKAKYGIPVEYFRAAANGVLDRVLTEVRAGRPRFDVVLNTRSEMLIMKTEGAFARYISPSYEAFPTAGRDRDSVLSPPYRVVLVSILYNTRLLKPDEAPKTLGDLLAAKWKGRIVMPDPTLHTTTAIWLFNLQKVLGAPWRPFVEGLARQVTLVDSFIPSVQKVIAGEFPVGIAYVKFVHVFGRDGAPLDYVRLAPVLGEVHHVALGARASHPNAARLFIDLFTSRLGLHALAQAGEFVLVPGVYPPVKDADKLHVVLMETLDTEGLARWKEEFRRVFRP